VTEPSATVSAQGEDRSDYQPVESWAGDDFGFAKATEGTAWTGATFAANWAALAREGKPRGAYHFLHPAETSIAQARHFIAVINAAGGLKPGDMLAVDSEIMTGVKVPTRAHLPVAAAAIEAATPDLVDAATKAFLDEVRALVNWHVTPLMTYTMEVVGQHLHTTAAAYPLLWFAHPSGTAPTAAMIAPFKDWAFWQWGAGARGDKDAYNGSAAALRAWLARYEHRTWVTWTSDGSMSLVELGGHVKALPSTILRKTLDEFGVFEGGLAGYINAGDLLDTPLPAGAKLRVPA
jgi:GH25 family lysozyme M1 (1,4-beta-N-acetylmuramidase)